MRQLCILLLLFSMIQLQAEEKKETGISRSDANLRAQRISGQVIIDGKLNEGFYDSVEWSAPFMVLGNMSQDINGLWVEADSKFKRSAATATLFYDEAFIYAAFKVPFPEDMQPKAEMQTGQNIWQDDCIEFFLHPGGERYFQILVNAKGAWQGLQHTIGGGNPLAWNSESIKVAAVLEQQQFSVELAVPYAEIGKTAAKPGEYWRGNFAREGATCGGLSTWAAVG
ncbi:MAG: hypothetical protein GX901_06500, partial [Lentisphaerae bacterium]|nr:hypothetical protein [Lentisphaerota bacterium]